MDMSRKILAMKPAGFHDPAKMLEKHRCIILFNVSATFLDSQVNGAVFMLQRTIDRVLLFFKFVDNSNMLTVSYLAVYAPWIEHKPILILAPNALVLNQWVEDIRNHFCDLIATMIHGEKSSELRHAQY